MLPNIFLAAINSLSIDKSFRKNKSYITPIIFTLILLQLTITFLPVNATHTGVEMADPIIFDEDYEIEKIIDGLNSPTTMSFLNNDLLVLEHFTGKVILVKDNGVKIFKPVLDLEVAYGPDYGLTGIETIENKVFLFFVPSAKDGYGVIKNSKNVVYEFTWNGKELVDAKLIKEFDGSHYRHHSGVLASDNDKNLYVVKGDGDKNGILQNFPDGEYFESGIFKINTEDFSSELIGMGIRNSFGLAVDPLTNKLWMTDNSIIYYDEINLVENGFNGGWKSVAGPSYRFDSDIVNQVEKLSSNPFSNFTYTDPKFSFYATQGITAIAFPNIVSFGKYQDSLFAADCNLGNIYKFKLNLDRNGFVFDDPNLSKDLVLDHNDSDEKILFADFSDCITDIEFRNDGMYVLSYNDGAIYRIYPKNPPSLTEQYLLGSTNEEIFCQIGFMKLFNESGYTECVPLELGLSVVGKKGIDLQKNIKLNVKNQNLEQFEFKDLNLSYSNFQNVKFSSKILSVNFTRANLSYTDLSNKDLTGTILTGADLTGANLTNVDLSGKDLSGTILTNVDLSDKDLTGTILTGADLTGANLTNVDLSGKDLSGTNLTNVDLSDKDLSGTILTGADLTGANLTNVDLSGKDLSGTNLTNVDLSDKDLSGTILTGADLSSLTGGQAMSPGIIMAPGAILTNVDLSGKDLTGANLTNVDLSGKDLTGTILTGADLTGANLTNVDLSGKDLSGTNLTNVDLSDKDLSGTILTGTELSGANLTNVDLSGKDLTGTILSRTEFLGYVAVKGADLTGANLTNVDLSGKDLSGTNLTNVDLSDKDLSGTILTGADLTGTNLTNVDLSGKDLTGTILTGADLSGVNFDPNNKNIFIDNELEKILYKIYEELLPYYEFAKTQYYGLINRLFS